MDSARRSATEGEERLAAAQVRSRLFWLLAEGLLHGIQSGAWPVPAVEASAGEGDNADPLLVSWRKLAAALNVLDGESRQRLAVEHTRLFGGLTEGRGPPPPFESAWREGHQAGAIPLTVVQAYAEAGFADIDLDAGPQDHLAVELKFVAMLAQREAAAWQRGEAAAAGERIRQQRDFLDRHLIPWVPRWTDVIACQTSEPLYRAFAEVLRLAMPLAAEEVAAPAG